MRKTALTALSTALLLGVLGAGSLAIASERDDGGGYKIGPQGQVFGADQWGTDGRNDYGFVQSLPTTRPAHKHGHPASVR
jgi:hypothetical protein